MDIDSLQSIMEIVFCLIFVFAVIAIIYMSSSKGRKRMMGHAIKMSKDMIEENEEDLKDLYTRSADIRKKAIEIEARAFKDGFTKDEFKESDDDIYCRYCGEPIDGDSKFCKKCGKEQ